MASLWFNLATSPFSLRRTADPNLLVYFILYNVFFASNSDYAVFCLALVFHLPLNIFILYIFVLASESFIILVIFCHWSSDLLKNFGFACYVSTSWKWILPYPLQLAKNKMDLNNRKMTNHPPSPAIIYKFLIIEFGE